MKVSQLVICLSLALGAFSAQAQQVKKYCSPEGAKVDIHLFGSTFEDGSLQKLSKKYLTDFKSSFVMGDRIRLYSHSSDGYAISFDQCVPGCPEAGLIEQLFSSACSATIAKRDAGNFDRSFAVAVLKSYDNPAGEYNIFESVQQLSEVYGGSSDSTKVYAVISMVPSGLKSNDRDGLNKLYRVGREAMQFPTDFPEVDLIGASSSKEVQEFWADVFKDKAKFNFVKF